MWRPMETAPRDGTPFIAAVLVYVNGVASHWDRHIIAADDETGEIPNEMEQGWSFDDYTHWAPLPEPPAA